MKKLLLILLLPALAYADTFWIRPGGNNSNSGKDSVNALLTFAAASDSIGAGDSLMVCVGRYSGATNRLVISASGTSGDPIVIRGTTPSGATLVGDGVNGDIYIVTLDGYNFINLERLRLADGDWITMQGCSVVTVSQCTMDSADYSFDYMDVRADTASWVTFRDCNIDGKHQRAGSDPDNGDFIRSMGGGHHFLFERDTLTGFSHFASLWNNYWTAADTITWVVWKDCIFYNNHGAVNLNAPMSFWVFDGCKFYQNGGWGGSGNSQTIDAYGHKGIFRWSLIYNDTIPYILASSPEARPQMVIISGDQEFELPRIQRWYNVTIDAAPSTLDKPYDVWGGPDTNYAKYPLAFQDDYLLDAAYINSVHFKNSIFSRNEDRVDFINITNPQAPIASQNITFTNCILYGRSGYSADVNMNTADSDAVSLLANVTDSLPRVFKDSIWTDYPGYLDTSTHDFSIDSNSFAQDRGTHLTTIEFTASNTDTARLVDPYWFCDGYDGLTTADSLKIEKNGGGYEYVRPDSINYENGVMYLPRTVDVALDAKVWYYRYDRWSGSAPDVGYYEYQMPASPAPPAGSTTRYLRGFRRP